MKTKTPAETFQVGLFKGEERRDNSLICSKGNGNSLVTARTKGLE